jgi:hypothetical protein
MKSKIFSKNFQLNFNLFIYFAQKNSWKSEKLRKNDLKDDRSIVTEKAEALNAFFYRYEYDFNKKSFVMN